MIHEYRELLCENNRIEAFRNSIFQVVNNSTVIAEIGTALGTYSFFSAMAGAKATYAIEETDLIEVAKTIARNNGMYERITFLKGHSTEIELPETVDYIIFEDYTPVFLYPGLKNVIVDAKKRFLKKNGSFIPYQFEIKIALCQANSFYKKLDIMRSTEDRLYEIDWSYTTKLAFNLPYYLDDENIQLLSKEKCIKKININSDEEFTFKFKGDIVVTHNGILHGIVAWWDCIFPIDNKFSNSPLKGISSWGQMFFPFRHTMNVKKGENVTVTLLSYESPRTDEINFKWAVTYKDIHQEFNTFKNSFIAPSFLVPTGKEYKLSLNKKGEFLLNIIQSVDRYSSVDEIYRKIYDSDLSIKDKKELTKLLIELINTSL